MLTLAGMLNPYFLLDTNMILGLSLGIGIPLLVIVLVLVLSSCGADVTKEPSTT